MLSVGSTQFDGLPSFHSTQFGYTTLIGDNGFPQYYQLDHVLLTRPKHTLVDHMQYDLELQIASFKQNTVWDLDYKDMVVTSFFFQAEDGSSSSPLLQQLLDAHDQGGGVIKERAGVDLQRAMGPQLKGDFYVYRIEHSDRCASAVWYVFAKPIRMSLAQKAELESIYPSLAHRGSSPNATAESVGEQYVAKPAVCMKNTLDEGTPAKYEFYLDRDTGRDRAPKSEYLILLPILGTAMLASAVMSSLFVTDHNGGNSGSKDLASSFSGFRSPGPPPSVIGSPSSYPDA
jgi:hypothetical protein